jgi:hypothetical protein
MSGSELQPRKSRRADPLDHGFLRKLNSVLKRPNTLGEHPTDETTNIQRPRCFRIFSIPSSVQRDQFRQYLEGLSQGPVDADRSSEATQTILTFSLAPEDDRWQVCTVTFSIEPLEFSKCSTNHVVKLPLLLPGIEDTKISIDVHFYGMTPLYCPEKEPAVVE